MSIHIYSWQNFGLLIKTQKNNNNNNNCSPKQKRKHPRQNPKKIMTIPLFLNFQGKTEPQTIKKTQIKNKFNSKEIKYIPDPKMACKLQNKTLKDTKI